MSLFKTRDWWSIPIENFDSEICHSHHLIVGNIANTPKVINNIVMGTFTGNMKIFSPQSVYNDEEEKEVYGYRPDHLLLEVELDEPILQLGIGKFVSGNSNLYLCVLHPTSVVVYSVLINEGQKEHSSQAKLVSNYKHNLHKKAFSLTTGNFGSAKGRDFIAILSLDGSLFVYEQESPGFVCNLPGFLLPGPLAYVPGSDSFVTQRSDWSLLSYKYQVLSSLIEDETAGDNQRTKKISHDWMHIASEAVLDFKVVSDPNGSSYSLIALTSRAFLCFKDSGVVKFAKKLEYNPACFTAFANKSCINLCIASHTQTLLIYKETCLIWASQLTFVPVAIERADFKGIKGSLVLLGEYGQLVITFLGTDPSLFVAPPVDTREINYELADKELNELNKIIRDSTKETGSLVNFGERSTDISISTSLLNKLEPWLGSTNVLDPTGVPCATMIINLATSSPVKDLRITVDVESPLVVTQKDFVMATLCDSCQILVKIYLMESFIPPSLSATIVVSFVGVSGIPYVTKKEAQLPIKLVVMSCAPEKDADHKITLSSSKQVVSLRELFPEFSTEGAGATATGFQFYGGQKVTVLSSRSTDRYRLQSDSLPAIWLVLKTFCGRLSKYWSSVDNKKTDVNTLGLTVTSPVPTQDLLLEIEDYLNRKTSHSLLESQLGLRTSQFRAVQKRLLTKFKDKTPSPLTNLDVLLEGSYRQVLQVIEASNSSMKGLEECGCRLNCLLRLVFEILSMQTELSKEKEQLLRASLFPRVGHDTRQGWEESINCIISFVLHQSVDEKSSITAHREWDPRSVALPFDESTFGKQFATLIDEVVKGRLEPQRAHSALPRSRSLGAQDMSSEDDFSIVDNTSVPLGSKLGEDRARSARIRSARFVSTNSKVPQTVNEDDESKEEKIEGRPLEADERGIENVSLRTDDQTQPLTTETSSEGQRTDVLATHSNQGFEFDDHRENQLQAVMSVNEDADIEDPEKIFRSSNDDNEW